MISELESRQMIDVEFPRHQTGGMVEIFILSSKTGQLGRGVYRTLRTSGSALSPVERLGRWIDLTDAYEERGILRPGRD